MQVNQKDGQVPGSSQEAIILDESQLTFPRLIHQTWKTAKLPELFDTWSQSWTRYNPDYARRLWTDEDIGKFIEKYAGDFVEEFNSYDHFIKRVDAFRYFLLYEYGGIYCDLDFECLKNFDPILEEYQDYDVILGYMGKDLDFAQSIPNAIMISKPKSPFWLYVISEMKQRINTGRPEYDTGPKLLKHCVDTYPAKKEVKILDDSLFYPLNWKVEETQKVRKLIFEDGHRYEDGEFKKRFPDSFAITYWAHSWENTVFE